MYKILLSVIISNVAMMVVHDGVTNSAFAKCAASGEKIYSTIISKIEHSEIANTNELSCEEITEINKNNPNSLLITSGRKRGKYTICLSDNPKNPCKYVIGTFNRKNNPSEMLSQVFDIPKPEQTQLNETVERLFFKPSLLID